MRAPLTRPRVQSVSNGAWNMIRQTLRQPARIRAWAVAVFDGNDPSVQARVNAFIGTLTRQMQNMGELPSAYS